MPLSRMAVTALVALPAIVSLACGSSAPVRRQTSPFTAEHARFFDDGIDFVADPDVLDGRWRDEWADDLLGRVQSSDVIAVVEVDTLRTDTDLDRKTTFRLIGSVDRVLLGDDPGEEVTFAVREGDAGFASVRGNERRILDAQFVAFIKWYEDANRDIKPHWHLAPATRAVLARVDYLIETRRTEPEDQRQRRIVVHEN